MPPFGIFEIFEQIITEGGMCGFGKAAADRNLFPAFQDEIHAVQILRMFHVDKNAPAAQKKTSVRKSVRKFPKRPARYILLPVCAVNINLVFVMLRIQNILKAEPVNTACGKYQMRER